MLSLEGRQLGNYDVIRRIRSGGMGAVYEGRQRTAFDRRVAIKVILGHYAEDREMRRSFAREAKTIARLHHPHILPLIEFGDEQGVLYLVMPFIEGGTLTSYLRRHLPDLHEVAVIFQQLLDAVEYAHEEGLIHRDIKSSNVLLESRRSGPPYAYLADFGLVRTIQQAELGRTHANEPIPLDQVPGTPHYMAPEQTWGVVTPATDIYALGVLLYQLLTGELPYNNLDDIEVIKMHLHAPVPNPRAADASIPAELAEVVMRAMAKRAEQRFPDVTDFRQAFRAAIDGPAAQADYFSAEPEEDFEVYELPPLPPKQSRPSQQLPPLAPKPPAPIEFRERQPRPAGEDQRRPLVVTESEETLQLNPGRPRITDDDPALHPPARQRARNTGDDPAAAVPPHPYPHPQRRRQAPSLHSEMVGGKLHEEEKMNQARMVGGRLHGDEERDLSGMIEQADAAKRPGAVKQPDVAKKPGAATNRSLPPTSLNVETELASVSRPSVSSPRAVSRPAIARPPVSGGQDRRVGTRLPRPAVSSPAPARPRPTRKRSPVALLVGMLVPLVLASLLLLSHALGLTIFPAGFPLLGAPPIATITLTARTQSINNTFLLTASPQSTQVDIKTRVLPDRSVQGRASGSRLVATSGTRTTPGIAASGTLLFANRGPGPVSVASGSIFTASGSIQVRLQRALLVPPRAGGVDGMASAPAVAIVAGQEGNLPPGALNVACCGGAVTVSNPTAFSGGSDAHVTHLVAQNDLDGVRAQLLAGLEQQALQQITSQLAPNEVNAGTPAYAITITPDHPTGSEAAQVNVSISVTTTVLVYNSHQVGELVRQLLSNQAAQALGPAYQLRGGFTIAPTTVEQQSSDGRLYLSVSVSGLWAYQVHAALEQQWRQVIKGGNLSLAQSYLATRPGISGVQIQLPFGSDHLPMDEAQIVFVVV